MWKAAQVPPHGKARNYLSVDTIQDPAHCWAYTGQQREKWICSKLWFLESNSYRKHVQVLVRSLVKRVPTMTCMIAYTETLTRIPHVTGTAMIRSEKDNSFLTVTNRLRTLNATHPQFSCIMLPREIRAIWRLTGVQPASQEEICSSHDTAKINRCFHPLLKQF